MGKEGAFHINREFSWAARGAVSLLFAYSALLSLSGCGYGESFFPASVRDQPGEPTGWQPPVAADLGTVSEAYVKYVPVTYPSPFSSASPLPSPTATAAVSQSFISHRIAAGERALAWVGALADDTGTTQTRAYGRIYTSHKLRLSSDVLAAGWAPIGRGFGLLDNGQADIDQLAVGISADGSVLSAFSGNAAASATVQSAVFGPGSAWSLFTSGIITLAKASGPFPLNGAAGPVPGYVSDIAWNRIGSGYYSYINSGSLSEAYVQRYAAFSGWDSATPGTLLGRQVAQVQLLDDGQGMTALWRTKFTPVNQIALGHGHTCALNNGLVRCWGQSKYGALGRAPACTGAQSPSGISVAQNLPADVNCLGSNSVIQVTAGDRHTCILQTDASNASGYSVACWGDNTYGQLGQGSLSTGSQRPLLVPFSAGETPVAVAAGAFFTCAATQLAGPTFKVYCWGENAGDVAAGGVIGTNATLVPGTCAAATAPLTTVQDPDHDAVGKMFPTCTSPVQITNGAPGSTFLKLAAGRSHACSISGTSPSINVNCWGGNDMGQVGQNVATTYQQPAVPIANYNFTSSATTPVDISLGSKHSCMRVQRTATPLDTYVYCWGSNNKGQLGGALSTYTPVGGYLDVTGMPTAVYVVVPSNTSALASGEYHSCVIGLDQKVVCWGVDTTNSTIWSDTPTTVSTSILAKGLAAGRAHTCLIDSLNQLRCWGTNTTGQLGDALGAGVNSTTPMLVTQPFDCASGKCLFASWSLDSNGGLNRRILLAENVVSFSGASDSDGNVLAVMLRTHPTIASTSCSVNSPNCQVRVFSAVRNALGQWLTPTQVDTTLTPSVTTFYQDSTVAGGTDYPTPAVAYMGSGQFMAAYPVIDISNLASRINSLYVRTYNVASGWTSSLTQLETATLAGAQTNIYRYTNDVKLVSDGQGKALLIAHGVNASDYDAYPSSRSFGYRAYRYIDGYWLDSSVPWSSLGAGSAGCPTALAGCGNPRVEAAIFTSGEAVMVYPAPEFVGSPRLRLFSVEYR